MSNKLLTRDEAYKAIQEGKKVKHNSFTRREFIHFKDGAIRDEDGYNFNEGWLIRCGGVWESGWSIYNA